jgi:hypothetical protein
VEHKRQQYTTHSRYMKTRERETAIRRNTVHPAEAGLKGHTLDTTKGMVK